MNIPPHGGDRLTFMDTYGCEPLDFSANTNPLGMSPLAKDAIRQAVDSADCYPDPYCRQLRKALAAHEGVSGETILCGNGAADLLYRLALAAQPKTALLPAPTFGEYEEALALVGCEVSHHLLQPEDGYRLTDAILPKITPALDILFLCEPNNPTGLLADPALLREIALRCRQTGTLLVVDECFGGFIAQPEKHSAKGHLANIPNLVIVKAFTKLYGMAGVRLGYLLCSNGALLQKAAKAGQHWPVSALAQAAGVAALGDEEWLQEALALVGEERPRLAAGLVAAGCTVYPGAANYLFFYSPVPGLGNKLAARGILIRDCSNYRGLAAGFYRVAVRTPQENNQLLAAISTAAEA